MRRRLERWLCPQRGPAAYRRGRRDALMAVRLLTAGDPKLDRLRDEIDRRLRELDH